MAKPRGASTTPSRPTQLSAAETPEQKEERAAGLLRADREKWLAAADAERRHRAEQQARAEADTAACQAEGENEVDRTSEECPRQDELPDDTEAGRSEQQGTVFG